MTASHPSNLKEHFRIQANVFLKKIKVIHGLSLRDKKGELVQNIVARLKILPYFSSQSFDHIVNEFGSVQLKHCLDVIAIENNYSSWQNYLQLCQSNDDLTDEEDFDTEGYELYRYNLSEGALNAWYNNYEEAKINFDRSGGYLLTYRHQYFICQAQHISGLGVDPADPDWLKIGKNWAKPNDSAAKQRLIEKLKKAQQNKG